MIAGTDHVAIIAKTPAEEIGILRFLVACALDREIGHREMDLWGEPGFLQSDVGKGKVEDPYRLFLDTKVGTKSVFFDSHREVERAICEKCTIAGLVTMMSILPVGGSGYGSAVNNGTAAYFVPLLPTVSDTIRACMVNRVDYGDPSWANPDDISPKGVVDVGADGKLLPWLTFVSRKVDLVPPEETGICPRCGEHALLITEMEYAAGSRVDKANMIRDPFCIYPSKRKGGALSAFPSDGMDAYDWPARVNAWLTNGKNDLPEVLHGHQRALVYLVVAAKAKIREMARLTIELPNKEKGEN